MRKKRFVLLITGSRSWDNYKSIQHRMMEAISEWLEDNPEYRRQPMADWLTVVHGGCPSGADRLADYFARNTLNCKVVVYPADWAQYGRRAGFVRNLIMVKQSNADACLAFIRDKSKGATGCRNEAKKFGIGTETFDYIKECELWPVSESKESNE